MKHKPPFEYSHNSTHKTPDAEADEHAPIETKSQTAGEKHHKRHEKTHHDKESSHKKEKKVEHDKEKEPADKADKKAEKSKHGPEATPEKRSEIVERSLQFKKLYEEVPVPRDPQVLARLLVAEHILAINQQIEEPAEPDGEVDKKTLLAAINSMGDLADKLENPEVESTPEVQEAYETVLQLARDALSEDAPIETIIEANTNSALASGFNDDAELPPAKNPGPAAPTAPIGALIGFLLQRRLGAAPSQPHVAATPPATSNDFGGGSNTAPAPATIPSRLATSSFSPPSRPPVTHLSPSLSPAEARLAYRESTRAEHQLPVRLGASGGIASLAVVSTFAALHHESSPSAPPTVHDSLPRAPYQSSHSVQPAETTRTAGSNAQAELASITRSQAAPAAEYAEVFRSPTKTTVPGYAPGYGPRPASASAHETYSSQPASSHGSETAASDNRKLEHRTLQELLTMAEVVPVGHGQRLRKIYEKGQIDKEGLIKILKSRSKNQDYIKEYHQQVTRRKNLLATSPEFLKSASTGNDVPESIPDIMSDTSQPPDTAPKEPKILPFLPPDLKNALSNSPPPSPTTGFDNPPPAKTPWLPIIGISLLALAAGVLIYFLITG